MTGAAQEVGAAGREEELARPGVAGRAEKPDPFAPEAVGGALQSDRIGAVDHLINVITMEVIDEIEAIVTGVKLAPA